MLTSSFTENQIIAAVTCLVALLLLYIIAWPAETAGETIGAVLRYLSHHRALRRDGEGRHRHEGPGLLRVRDDRLRCSSPSARSSRCAGDERHLNVRSSGTTGLVGLILLFFGGVAWALTQQIGLFVGLNLLLGGVRARLLPRLRARARDLVPRRALDQVRRERDPLLRALRRHRRHGELPRPSVTAPASTRPRRRSSASRRSRRPS